MLLNCKQCRIKRCERTSKGASIHELRARKDVTLECKKALTPNGKYLSVDDGSPTLQSEDLRFLTELIEAGQMKAIIGRCYPLEHIVEAHRFVDHGHKKGNVGTEQLTQQSAVVDGGER